MHNSLRTALALVLFIAPGRAQEPSNHAAAKQPPCRWCELVDRKDREGAKALCNTMTASADLNDRVEAEKCLANVSLMGNDVLMLQGDDAGGGSISGGYKDEAANEAISHLNKGIKLAPQDLSIHQGRLHVLEACGRYDAMLKALEESCTTYKGKDALQAWLAYSAELYEARQLEAGLAFTRVLDAHYPNSPDVIANIGAFLSVLKRESEAIPYLEKAVQLAPSDPINAWDLARAYDYAGKDDLAAKWYDKGLSLMTDPEQRGNSLCLYSRFVETKLHQRERACELQKANCEAGQQSACTPANEAEKK